MSGVSLCFYLLLLLLEYSFFSVHLQFICFLEQKETTRLVYIAIRLEPASLQLHLFVPSVFSALFFISHVINYTVHYSK
jgi:hypothetical protein